MSSYSLVKFGDAWASLDDQVREQVRDVLDLGDQAGCNPNDIRLAIDKLGGFHGDIDAALESWLSYDTQNPINALPDC